MTHNTATLAATRTHLEQLAHTCVSPLQNDAASPHTNYYKITWHGVRCIDSARLSALTRNPNAHVVYAFAEFAARTGELLVHTCHPHVGGGAQSVLAEPVPIDRSSLITAPLHKIDWSRAPFGVKAWARRTIDTLLPWLFSVAGVAERIRVLVAPETEAQRWAIDVSTGVRQLAELVDNFVDPLDPPTRRKRSNTSTDTTSLMVVLWHATTFAITMRNEQNVRIVGAVPPEELISLRLFASDTAPALAIVLPNALDDAEPPPPPPPSTTTYVTRAQRKRHRATATAV